MGADLTAVDYVDHARDTSERCSGNLLNKTLHTRNRRITGHTNIGTPDRRDKQVVTFLGMVRPWMVFYGRQSAQQLYRSIAMMMVGVDVDHRGHITT